MYVLAFGCCVPGFLKFLLYRSLYMQGHLNASIIEWAKAAKCSTEVVTCKAYLSRGFWEHAHQGKFQIMTTLR